MKKLLITLATTLLLASCSQQQGNAEAQSENCQAGISQAVSDVMMTRRSIRQYHDLRIGRDTLDQIMQLGINAPNGQNRQAYEVRVMDNPELVKELSDAVVKENPQMGERPGFKNIFVGAPCVVFIAADRSYDVSPIDCGLLGENIMLSAWSMGIGSCCLAGPIRMLKNSEAAAPYLQRLNFSEGYELLYCIGLGYPAEEPAARPRKAEKVQYVD